MLVHRIDVVARIAIKVENGLLAGRIEADRDIVVLLLWSQSRDPELVADLRLERLAGLRVERATATVLSCEYRSVTSNELRDFDYVLEVS